MDPDAYETYTLRTRNGEYHTFRVLKAEVAERSHIETPGGRMLQYATSTTIRLKKQDPAPARPYKTAWEHLLCDDLD